MNENRNGWQSFKNDVGKLLTTGAILYLVVGGLFDGMCSRKRLISYSCSFLMGTALTGVGAFFISSIVLGNIFGMSDTVYAWVGFASVIAAIIGGLRMVADTQGETEEEIDDWAFMLVDDGGQKRYEAMISQENDDFDEGGYTETVFFLNPDGSVYRHGKILVKDQEKSEIPAQVLASAQRALRHYLKWTVDISRDEEQRKVYTLTLGEGDTQIELKANGTFHPSETKSMVDGRGVKNEDVPPEVLANARQALKDYLAIQRSKRGESPEPEKTFPLVRKSFLIWLGGFLAALFILSRLLVALCPD